jgi:beta-lactamase regulating signal transducer with metallopeptidase domain
MTAFAQLAVGRVLNSLPEGILIALCAWLLLRLMGRQNAGTRYAVWLVALAGVVGLPILSGLGSTQHDLSLVIPHARPEITLPAFWAAAFFVLWIAVAAVALARVIAGVWQVRQIRRSCAEIPVSELDPVLQELLAENSRPIRLLVSEKARVPAALGFRNPAIVLPAWTLRDLTADELRPILIHELAHLRRHDDWTNLLQKTVRAILFFHPAVWWIDARLSLEREMACDDAVVAATGNPRAYAGCLIDLIEKGCERPWVGDGPGRGRPRPRCFCAHRPHSARWPGGNHTRRTCRDRGRRILVPRMRRSRALHTASRRLCSDAFHLRRPGRGG